jgi:hypothetical protein
MVIGNSPSRPPPDAGRRRSMHEVAANRDQESAVHWLPRLDRSFRGQVAGKIAAQIDCQIDAIRRTQRDCCIVRSGGRTLNTSSGRTTTYAPRCADCLPERTSCA